MATLWWFFSQTSQSGLWILSQTQSRRRWWWTSSSPPSTPRRLRWSSSSSPKKLRILSQLVHYWLSRLIGSWQVQKVGQSRHLFLIHWTHRKRNCALCETVRTQILQPTNFANFSDGCFGKNYIKCKKKVCTGPHPRHGENLDRSEEKTSK